MKKYILFFLSAAYFLLKLEVRAQQESIYTQYMFNRLIVNPAYAGTKGVISFTALYRHQWADFPGAPRTFTASLHGATSNMRHGLGLSFSNDIHGALRISLAGINYAFRIPIEENRTYLSLGLQAAGIQYALESNKLDFRNRADPLLSRAEENVLLPDVGTGIFFNTPQFYAGFSVAHLIENNINILEGGKAKLARHYFLNAGYDISLDRYHNSIILTPSFLARVATNSPLQLDINLMIMLIQKFWAGVSYRTLKSSDAISFMVGFYPFKLLRIGYGYDYALGDLRDYQNGTHEIMLSLDFGNSNRAKVLTPRYF
ncbi:MAG: type IX secretion system membrane protein PorP/SprF [Bacteroidia bacterium]|nr:type IX secretion system membrane protein PorP/SprF [Bacteroidia bacterium]MDW8159056.1 type IX secretion system membrane protein PorP/SprF [Bacteroidia bacterium]